MSPSVADIAGPGAWIRIMFLSEINRFAQRWLNFPHSNKSMNKAVSDIYLNCTCGEISGNSNTYEQFWIQNCLPFPFWLLSLWVTHFLLAPILNNKMTENYTFCPYVFLKYFLNIFYAHVFADGIRSVWEWQICI